MRTLIGLLCLVTLGLAVAGCDTATTSKKTETTVQTPQGEATKSVEQKVETTDDSVTKTTTEKVEKSGDNPPPTNP